MLRTNTFRTSTLRQRIAQAICRLIGHAWSSQQIEVFARTGREATTTLCNRCKARKTIIGDISFATYQKYREMGIDLSAYRVRIH